MAEFTLGPDIEIPFGDYLREAIRKAGYIKVSRLAKDSGVSQSTLSRLVRNLQEPNIKTLRKLAPALKVSYEELLIAAHYIDATKEISIFQAAPDMYEALKRITAIWFSNKTSDKELISALWDAMNRGKQALTKAEGKEA